MDQPGRLSRLGIFQPRFAASRGGDDVILVVDCAAAEEGPRGVLERHQVRKLNRGTLKKFIGFSYFSPGVTDLTRLRLGAVDHPALGRACDDEAEGEDS